MARRLPRPSWKDCDRALKRDGWFEARQTGDHHHYAHPLKPGLVTIPERDTLAAPLMKSILRQAGLTTGEFIRLLGKGSN